MFKLTRQNIPWLASVIRAFIRIFRVNMDEALESDPNAYRTFNEFFTRALRPGARPIVTENDAIACPADGRISQLGEINKHRIFQAKGQDYSVVELLGGSLSRSTPFENGRFCTIYLSPRDYHRVHIPTDAELEEMIYIPGRLFGVAASAVNAIPRLFARNERVVGIFETRHNPMAIVMVGALNVAAIETVWSGLITPPAGNRIQVVNYSETTTKPRLLRGQEMGRFNLGSTVILLFPPNTMAWDPELRAEAPVKMGQRLGTYIL